MTDILLQNNLRAKTRNLHHPKRQRKLPLKHLKVLTVFN